LVYRSPSGLPLSVRLAATEKAAYKATVTTNSTDPAPGPRDTPEAHLAFALKHEGFNLELLSHAFAKIDKAALTRWIAAEPTGQYAGKAGFLYEWLTNETLLVAGVGGSDCDSLDSSQVVTAETPSKEIKPQDQ